MAVRSGRNASVKLAAEERRAKVSVFYLRHVGQYEIARQLGCSQTTVSLDIKLLIARWKIWSVGPIEKRRIRELAELDDMEREAALGFVRTQDKGWLETRLHIKGRRAALLGLDAPQKLEAVGADGQPVPVTIAQILVLAERHAQVLDSGTVEGELVSLSEVSTNGHG